MASAPKARADRSGIRPALLAGGLALMWFVEFQAGPLPPAVPGWGVALVVAGRLFADFVGAAIVVSLGRIGIAAVRLVIADWRRRGAE